MGQTWAEHLLLAADARVVDNQLGRLGSSSEPMGERFAQLADELEERLRCGLGEVCPERDALGISRSVFAGAVEPGVRLVFGRARTMAAKRQLLELLELVEAAKASH